MKLRLFHLAAAVALMGTADGQGIITTVAGTSTCCASTDGSPAVDAYLTSANGIALDKQGNLYIWDTAASKVRVVNAAGVISTLAGNGTSGYTGDGGPAKSAELAGAGSSGLAVDAAGNLYIADSQDHVVRKVDTSGNITTYAGTGSPGFSGDGATAAKALLNAPDGLAVDSAGNLYIADTNNYRIRKVTPSGVIITFAGNGNVVYSGDGVQATATAIDPSSVAVDPLGNVYISEGSESRIRKVDTNGVISTIAGQIKTTRGFSGDGGPATAATLKSPIGMVADAAGNLYIADSQNGRIRKIDATGIITTYAGVTGTANTPPGDGGPATQAYLATTKDVLLDSAGNLYLTSSPSGIWRVRKVTPGAVAAGPSISLVANAFGDKPLIAPNTWVYLKGTSLAPAGDSRIWQGADFASGELPTELDGVSVTINGKPAYVYYISPTQVNILTPPDPVAAAARVVLTNGGVQSNVIMVQAQLSSLSLFEFVSSTGSTYVYGRHGGDNSLIGPTSLYPGLTTPVKPGESIYIAANGFGATDTPAVSGAPTQTGNLPQPFPVVTIGGIQAAVSFAGLVSVGTYQINLVVPNGVPDGDLPIQVTYDQLSTQPNLLIAVQH